MSCPIESSPGHARYPLVPEKLQITGIAPRTIHDLNDLFDDPLADTRQDIRLLRNSCTSREYRGEATWPSTARTRLRACARCAVAARSGLERSHQGSFLRHRLRSRVGVCGGHGCGVTILKRLTAYTHRRLGRGGSIQGAEDIAMQAIARVMDPEYRDWDPAEGPLLSMVPRQELRSEHLLPPEIEMGSCSRKISVPSLERKRGGVSMSEMGTFSDAAYFMPSVPHWSHVIVVTL